MGHRFTLVFVLFLAAPALCKADRTLAAGPGWSVTGPDALNCGAAPKLVVEGANSLFDDKNGADLQKIVDSALAKVLQECPGLPSVAISSKNGKSQRLASASRGWDVTGRGRPMPTSLAVATAPAPAAPPPAPEPVAVTAPSPQPAARAEVAPASVSTPSRGRRDAPAPVAAPAPAAVAPAPVVSGGAPRYRDPRLPSLDNAKGMAEKCELLLDWLGRLSREYSDQDFSRGLYGRQEGLAVNLFRDEDFVQVFGQRYDQTSVTWRSDLHRKVISDCYGVPSGRPSIWNRGPNRDYAQAFQPYRNILDRAFLGGPGMLAPENISRAIAQRRETRRWMDSALANAAQGQTSLEAFQQLQGNQNTGRQQLRDLWPTEQQFFASEMEARMGAVAAGVVETWAATLNQQGATLDDAKALAASKTRLDAPLAAMPADRRDAALAQYNAKLDAILEPLAAERTAALASIPETLAGARQALEWRQAFDQEFAGTPERPPLQQARQAGEQRRRAILEASGPEWQVGLLATVHSQADVQAAARELNELFPNIQDRSLPIYRQYQQPLLTMLEEQKRAEAEAAAAKAAAAAPAQPKALAGSGGGLPAPPPPEGETTSAQSRPSSDETGIIFPTLVNALYDGNFDAIPDDQNVRGYMVSLFKGFNESCGEGPSNIAFAAMEYGFPQYRRMQENPFSMLGDLMQAMVSMRDQGMRGLENYTAENAVLVQEGVEDARTLAVTYKCNSWTTRAIRTRLGELMQQRRSIRPAPSNPQRFVSLMHPRYREIMGIETPDAVQPTRGESLISACMGWMKSSASSQSENTEFCRCLTDGALKTGLPDAELGTLELSFSNDTLREISQRYPALSTNVSGCYR